MEVDDQLRSYLLASPKLQGETFVAPGAVLVGDVTLGAFSSVWFNAVLRADINRIVVGHHTNIQDNCVLHLADTLPCLIGNYVTVGHGAIVHACRLGDGALIGMGATILDGAAVGQECLVGARSLVTQGTELPEGSLVMGSPAEVVRPLSKEERLGLRAVAEKYVRLATFYRQNRNLWRLVSSQPAGVQKSDAG